MERLKRFYYFFLHRLLKRVALSLLAIFAVAGIVYLGHYRHQATIDAIRISGEEQAKKDRKELEESRKKMSKLRDLCDAKHGVIVLALNFDKYCIDRRAVINLEE